MVNKCILFVCLLNLAVLTYLGWQTFEAPGVPEIPVTSRSTPHQYPCELVRVIDGNTVVLHVDLGFNTWLRDLTIHLSGVETPPAGADKARDLTAYLKDALEGRTLVVESVSDTRGSFNRWFGVLYADGESLNARLQTQLAMDD